MIRNRIVAEALTWIGTPFHDCAGIRGVGVDCAYFPIRVINALGMGLESKFNERLDKAISIDPKFAHAGPLAVKGRYYFELPWPKRNLWKSADWLKRALTADPNALRAMAWLAETQWQDGNPTAARETLARLEKASLPDDPAEERRCKALGRKIAQQMDKEH